MRSLEIIPPHLRGVPTVALSCVLFALMAVLARSLSGDISAGQLVLLRFLTGLGFVAGYYALTRTRPVVVDLGLWAQRGLLGGGAVYLYFFSIERLEVGPASLLNNTFPVWAALFAAGFLGEPLRRAQVGGLVASLLGAALVVYATVPLGDRFELGIGVWAGLASAVLTGGAATTMRALRRTTDALTIFFSFCLFGALLALPVALADWRPLTAEVWLSALGVGVAALVAQLLYTHALGFASTAAASATALLTPAFAWAMGVAFLGEAAPALALLGALLCVGGVVWPMITLRAPPVAPPQE